MEKPDIKHQQGFTFLGILLIASFSLVVATGVFITLRVKQVNPPSLLQNSPKPTPSPQSSLSPVPTPFPQPSFSPEPSTSPQPTNPPPVGRRKVNLNETFIVKTGDVIEISDTGLTVKITSLTLPSADTYDLPNNVAGQAIYGGQTEQFNLIVGGNQPYELQEQRRQKKVFNTFIIYAKKVAAEETTLIVTQ